jgi:hypothetical protein
MRHRQPLRGWTCLAGALAAGAGLAAQSDSQALQRMVATERAFAAATAEIGTRDGFLTFLADDAVALDAGASGAAATAVRAKDGLRARPLAKLPILNRLMWEPRTGQVSDDGTLGWLTGPYIGLNQLTRDITAKGAYFSVWKRQTDGTWRVWLDEGVSLPDVWRDGSEFRAAADPDEGTAGTPGESLDAVERAVATGGDPWRARLASGVRLHREGQMPLVGRDAVAAWSRADWTTVRFSVIRTEQAGSNDLGVTMGGYDATTIDGPERGTWVRVWKRDATNRWQIVFETSKSST